MLGPASGDPCAPAVRSVRSSPCGDDRSLTTRTPASLLPRPGLLTEGSHSYSDLNISG